MRWVSIFCKYSLLTHIVPVCFMTLDAHVRPGEEGEFLSELSEGATPREERADDDDSGHSAREEEANHVSYRPMVLV